MLTRRASSLDLFTDSVRIMGDATLCGVMEFDRRIDPEKLENAAQACLLAHPILHSRLVRGNRPAFWELVRDVHVPHLHVEEFSGCYHHLVIGSVDPYGTLQFRVRLLRDRSRDVIVINLAHAAADATGLHTLMFQILQEYRVPGTVTPAEGGIPERDTLWTRSLVKEEISFTPGMMVIDPLWPDPFGTSHSPSTYHLTRINPEILGAVRRYVGALGGNVNDAILASYFLAMSDLTQYNGPIAVFFPVNLRQHLMDGSRLMSNQATNVHIVMERRPGEGMTEILARVIRETLALKSGGIGIPDQVRMDFSCDPEGVRIHEMVGEMAALQKSGLADIFVSNPGFLKLPECDGLTDAYVCYPGSYMPTTCFITSTFRGTMTITMGYQDSERAKAGTGRAMDLFSLYLQTLVDFP
jgi:NRPS condensation-like uncharacterized protein